MGGIVWTDETWNPVKGCSRVSEGCRHCYAEQVAARLSGPGQPYEGLVRLKRGPSGIATAVPAWNGTIKLVPEHLGDPLRWRRPRRVFVNSMSDLFHEAISDEYIAAVWAVMAASPRHVFQVLTKRPERARAWLDAMDDAETFRRGQRADDLVDALAEYSTSAADAVAKAVGAAAWPLPNVWLGVSVEDQATADERIPLLLQCPAAVRWVSYEPALGPVDFRTIRLRGTAYYHSGDHGLGGGPALDWVVVGGESGPRARQCDVEWIRKTVRDCKAAGVPVFVKQLGANYVDAANGIGGRQAVMPPECGSMVWRLRDPKGGDPSEWPEDLRVQQWPRQAGTP